ncbi:MAG: hypothetical protein WCX69_02190 [Candidatus Paceibacterota bacterium]
MDYEFGDIIDCRNAPSISDGGHFVLILGVLKKGNTEKILYYSITSRVYAVFNKILDFFNDCLSRKDARFLHFFNKEKNKAAINPHGRLFDAFFLDKKTNYNLCLDEDSMIVINKDPNIEDITTFEQLKKEGLIGNVSRLSNEDVFRLYTNIKTTGNISPRYLASIGNNFNLVKKRLVKTQ